jgi:hypothetical protein
MAQAPKLQHTTLDILKIMWLLSLIPWTLEIAKVAPGFPDVAPVYTWGYWFAFGVFGILQLAVTFISWYRKPLTTAFFIAMVISTLLLSLEEFVGFLALMFLNALVTPVVLILAIVLIVRLAKRL